MHGSNGLPTDVDFRTLAAFKRTIGSSLLTFLPILNDTNTHIVRD